MHLFPCQDYHVYKSCSLTKNLLPRINCNMLVDEHPALIVDSMSLQYDIIFRTDFLDKCRFHVDYYNNLVHWMEYDAQFCDTSDFFLAATNPLHSPQLILTLKITVLAKPMLTLLQHTSLMQNMTRPTSTMLPSIITISHWTSTKISSIYYPKFKHIKLFDCSLWVYPHKKSYSNWEIRWWIITLVLYLTYTNKLSKENSIRWLHLISLNHVGHPNGCPPPSSSLKKMGKFDK